MRTTSSEESLNSVMQRRFSKRTTIFRFALDIQMHESIKATDLYQLSKNNILSPQLQRKRQEDRERDEKIKYFSALLNNNSISVAYFLKAMSRKDILPPGLCEFHAEIFELY